MQPIETLSNYFFNYNSPLYWRDLVEILFFSSLFYYAAIWLKKDKQKNLLPSFYGYCIAAFGAHYLGLTTISYAMFLFSPAVAMVFILVHQERLQKNFVALKNITPARRIQLDWLETLIRTCLRTINDKKEITCIIEQQNSLADFLETPLQFNARLEQGLLDILLASPTFDQQRMIWVNTHGQLVGINAAWVKQVESHNLDLQIKELPAWKQRAIFFTTKADAIVMHINPTSRTFDVVLNGMVVDRMHATKTLELIKKYVVSKNTASQLKGLKHESVSQKRAPEQRST